MYLRVITDSSKSAKHTKKRVLASPACLGQLKAEGFPNLVEGFLTVSKAFPAGLNVQTMTMLKLLGK